MVRQRSAKPLFPSSNLGAASMRHGNFGFRVFCRFWNCMMYGGNHGANLHKVVRNLYKICNHNSLIFNCTADKSEIATIVGSKKILLHEHQEFTYSWMLTENELCHHATMWHNNPLLIAGCSDIL